MSELPTMPFPACCDSNTTSTQPCGNPATASLAAPEIEGYQIISELGKGGMGVVWRAIQISTGRQVALKIMSAAMIASPEARARFEREVKLASSFEHPNIARVYDSGIRRGIYCYAMELIEGLPPDAFVRNRKLSITQIIALVRRIALAVAAAHTRGIIHRDLKPSNILVTPDGEPHILDLGLAKAIREAPDYSQISIPGDIFGTVKYMSPEQAAADDTHLDVRSDVYSLGVILFNLLTGAFPHDFSNSYWADLRRIATTPPKRLRQVKRDADRELDTILTTALQHDLSRRYASSLDLARDLQNYLTGEPLIARPPSTLYLLQRKIRKHRIAASLAAVAFASLNAGIAFYIYSIEHERKLTNDARLEAVSQAQAADLNAFLAREQRGLALQTINRIISDVFSQPVNSPADERWRSNMLSIAADSLREMSHDARFSASSLDPSMGIDLINIGDTLLQARRIRDAQVTYDKAVTLLAATPNARPDHISDSNLVRALERLARTDRYLDDFQSCQSHVQRAMQLLDSFDTRPETAPLFRSHRLSLLSLQADLALDMNRNQDAVRFARAALAIAQTMQEENVKDAEARVLVISARQTLVDTLLQNNDAGVALAECATLLKTIELAADRDSNIPEFQLGLADALIRAADAASHSGQPDLARDFSHRAAAASVLVIAAAPALADAASLDLGLALTQLALLTPPASDPHALHDLAAKAHAALESLSAPDRLPDPRDRRRLAAALRTTNQILAEHPF